MKKRVLGLAAAEVDLKLLVLDGSSVNTIDSTGAETLEAIASDLQRRGIRLALAGFRTEVKEMLVRTGAMAAIGTDFVFPTLKSAAKAFQSLAPEYDTGIAEDADVPPNAGGDEEQPSP